MAAKTQAAPPQNASTNTTDFDWSKALPEGFDVKGFEKTGGLAPIYSPKEAHENGFEPLIGYAVRTQLLPPIQQGKETFIPEMIMVRAIRPTKAVTGKRRDGQEIVDVNVGDYVMVPITGNIGTNERLLAACDDPNEVSLVGFRVTGTRQVNDMPSPMWVWEMMVHQKKTLRKGTEFELLLNSNERPRMLGTTSNGSKFDKDGVVQERASA